MIVLGQLFQGGGDNKTVGKYFSVLLTVHRKYIVVKKFFVVTNHLRNSSLYNCQLQSSCKATPLYHCVITATVVKVRGSTVKTAAGQGSKHGQISIPYNCHCQCCVHGYTHTYFPLCWPSRTISFSSLCWSETWVWARRPC